MTALRRILSRGSAQIPKSSTDRKSTTQNKCLLQTFEWHTPDDRKHYWRLISALESYSRIGVTAIWLPPGCKAANPSGNGYDIYDLYDLGEFYQKGSVPTKWGSKAELLELSEKAKSLDIALYFDAVLSHRAGADRVEECTAVLVDSRDRTKEIGTPHKIRAWLGFDFEGRGEKYSRQKYHCEHFNGTDFDESSPDEKGIFKIIDGGKNWAQDVCTEFGNFDYLLLANFDSSNSEVRSDAKRWGEWITNELSLSGFRIDAIKHISRDFAKDWIGHLNGVFGSNRLFFLGEYWAPPAGAAELCDFLDKMEHSMSLYDPGLVTRFSILSKTERADLRTVFDGTLVQARPTSAVTLVRNHDTQPGELLETPIEPWFFPLAYALILLRRDGYPCVFYGDLYGIRGPKPHGPTCNGKLPDLILARKLYAYGKQNDYFDAPNCIGWTREGTMDRPDGVAVLMSNAGIGKKKMKVGKTHAGEVWVDVMGLSPDVKIGRKEGVFTCAERTVSIFIRKGAAEQAGFGGFYVPT